MFISKDIEFPPGISAQSLEPIIHCQILVLHLLQHDREHDNIVDRRILQQIDLKPKSP